MSVDIRLAEDFTPDRWNGLAERANAAGAVHQWEALEALAIHSDSTVYRLIGYKGQEPVGICPLFERRYGPVSAVFSPPPALRIPYLGPGLLNMAKLSQRKTERRQRRFVDGIFDWIESQIGPEYVHFRTGPGYPDVRPFTWNGCSVDLAYTYSVDITPERSVLLDRFSRDARSNIRAAEDSDPDIAERGPHAIDPILEQVQDRYESQGISFGVPFSFVHDLYERAPEGTLRPYTCRVDGEFAGGILALEFGDTIARWQGGVKPDLDGDFPINDALDWALIRAGRRRGRKTYDLVGAGTPKVNDYKSKFGPDLVPFYSIECGTVLGTALSRLYKQLS